ncbi:MAG: hypothetical protein BWX70_01269 [Verrucomicrobia bacterium ADurb.Bin070]|nr:MAG: hypothetical protein BWX70_01269 [Verrucomicrobia bacterium ADurb.Bin070]
MLPSVKGVSSVTAVAAVGIALKSTAVPAAEAGIAFQLAAAAQSP